MKILITGAKGFVGKNLVCNLRNIMEGICCTRYGNVMCSRGSVIPLFIDQIRAGKPISITDPT